MKVDAHLIERLEQAPQRAAEIEALGYDGLLTVELDHDPFFPLLLAAQNTQRIELMTGIAVAFARNPMLLANIGWDLQAYSKGRFSLGLGSQIKPHITKRFSMPWSQPAARMQELIEAIRAIWESWQNNTRLNFRGDFYQHTLMTPMFNPGPNPYGNPRIALAAVGPMMTKVVGRVADGFMAHAFQTADYLRQVTYPALHAGLAESGRSREDIEVICPLFVVSGFDEADTAQRKASCKQQIAFYGSTPAYIGVLDHHGWGDAHYELHSLSKQGKWVEMANIIDDTMLEHFAIVGEPHEIAAKVKARFGDLADRVQLTMPSAENEQWQPVIAAIGKN